MFRSELVGVMEPFQRLFREFETETSAKRLAALIEVVQIINEDTPFALMVTDSLAYGMSTAESDIDIRPMFRGMNGRTLIPEFVHLFHEGLPRVKLQIDYWYDHRDVTDALNNVYAYSDNASDEDLRLISDYHADLTLGGILIGHDFEIMRQNVEHLVAMVPSLPPMVELRKEKLMLDEELGYISTMRYPEYLNRIKRDPKFKALSPFRQRTILRRIESKRQELLSGYKTR